MRQPPCFPQFFAGVGIVTACVCWSLCLLCQCVRCLLVGIEEQMVCCASPCRGWVIQSAASYRMGFVLQKSLLLMHLHVTIYQYKCYCILLRRQSNPLRTFFSVVYHTCTYRFLKHISCKIKKSNFFTVKNIQISKLFLVHSLKRYRVCFQYFHECATESPTMVRRKENLKFSVDLTFVFCVTQQYNNWKYCVEYAEFTPVLLFFLGLLLLSLYPPFYSQTPSCFYSLCLCRVYI